MDDEPQRIEIAVDPHRQGQRAANNEWRKRSWLWVDHCRSNERNVCFTNTIANRGEQPRNKGIQFMLMQPMGLRAVQLAVR